MTAPNPPAIRLSRVGKVFAARSGTAAVHALKDISLDVPAGTILGVIGRSGAGKSTLIRLVNGLEHTNEGQISLDGRDVTALTEAQWRTQRRNIGMVFQHFNLLSSRTVFGNIALPLEILGTPKPEIEARVARLLDIVGLADKRERYPAELSGGQKQRVGIARALATEPRILLCDEATSALDPETTRSILALLKQVNRELGITILLITHEIGVVRDICDRVAVLEAGQIVEQGPVFKVLTQPEHEATKAIVEGVTRVELPATLAPQVLASPEKGGQAVLRIGFVGENASGPIISRLTSTIGVDVNILAGRIDTIAGQPFGSFIVAVAAKEPAFGAVRAALVHLGFETEVLGYLPPAIAATPITQATREEALDVA